MCPLTGLRSPWTVIAPGRRRATQGAGSNYKECGEPAPDLQPEKAKPADREALGHSRGGLSTKVHLVADQRCRPLAFVTTVGQRHDAVAFELVLGKVAVARLGPGRPRTRPDYALADKAYSSKAIRGHLAKRGIKAVIPVKEDQAGARARKGSRGGRPPKFDKARYRQRNTVERSVNKLRATRAVATRYDKRDYIYRGTIAVAAIRIWLRDPVPAPLRDTP
jgi:transposase